MIWQKIRNSVSDGLFRDSVRDSVIAENTYLGKASSPKHFADYCCCFCFFIIIIFIIIKLTFCQNYFGESGWVRGSHSLFWKPSKHYDSEGNIRLDNKL